MQKALFLNKVNKVTKLRLKIENEKSRILKEDDDIRLPMRTFTLAPREDLLLYKQKEEPREKSNRYSKQHVRFKLEHAKTLNENDSQDRKGLNIRIKKMKQPKMKIIKSYSTSKLIKIPKTETLYNQSTEETLQQKNEQILLHQIIEALKNRVILLQTSLNYSIKKDDFASLISYLIYLLTNKKRGSKCSANQKYPQLSFLVKPICKLQSSIKSQLRESPTRLELHQNTLSFSYNSQKYSEDQINSSNNLAKQYESFTLVSREVNALKDDKMDCIKTMKNIKCQLQEYSKQKAELQIRINGLKDMDKELIAGIENKKATLASINQETENVVNYLSKNNCKTIGKTSEQYKRIQNQMREFALQLQSNHMASQISYEPKPFDQVEGVILEEMKKINKTIIQDVDILPELKEKLMRNFILRAMENFKCKDKQMLKVNRFKTTCIRTYVDNMKKWIDNWTLKQQYLAHMRKQFIYDSKRLGEKLTELKDWEVKNKNKVACSLVEDLEGISYKIIENYKLGNSFY